MMRHFRIRLKRDVYLNGEAYFEVAKNAEKPFIVHAADLNVNGTWYQIQCIVLSGRAKHKSQPCGRAGQSVHSFGWS